MKKIFLIFALLLLPLGAQAQSSGAACTPNGASAWTSGTPLICTSGTWAIDTARVGNSSASCVAGIQGTMRMNGTTMEYCNGTAWTSVVPTGGGTYSASVSTFDASGTWNKPATGTVALIECWGAGGSGAKSTGCGGGGGGGYNFRWVALSAMGSTETVTVGAGGAAVTTNIAGNAGGNSSVGSLLTAYGGAGGSTSGSLPGGGGGGQMSAGTNADPGRPWIASTIAVDDFCSPIATCQQGNGTEVVSYIVSLDCSSTTVRLAACGADSPAVYHGGGGGGQRSTSPVRFKAGGASVWGGGGGGGCNASGLAAGASQYAGSGGAGGTTGNGTAGTQPGGGGGGTNTGTSSGAGAAGRCRVTTF